MNARAPKSRASSRARLLVALAPLAGFLLLATLFYVRLGAGDATRIPSALIGKQIPQFALPALEGLGAPGFSAADLKTGEPSVLNVFASWCGPCHQEHPDLLALKRRGVRVFGLAYKDTPANLLGFLKERGNPFAAVGVDAAGRVAIDFGVYGVPETFIIRGDGAIAEKIVGEVNVEKVMAALEKAKN